MARNQRLALLAVAVIGASVALVIAQPGDDDASAPTTLTAATANSTATTAVQTQTTTTTAEPPVERIRLRGGAPVGGVRTIRASVGERVRIVVRPDVTDVLHLHGYDLERAAAPGETARFTFTARIPGLFEIELEQRALLIAKLEVRP